VTVNSLTIVAALENKYYKKIINNSFLSLCDGEGVRRAIKLLYGKNIEKNSGIDLIPHILNKAEENGWRVFFFGAESDVINGFVEKIKKTYKKLKIAGFSAGYYDKISAIQVVRRIRDSNADILFAGLGQPKQEIWIYENSEKINIPVCAGVGGSFDVLSGKLRRAPLLMRNLGLEWLYRMILEPSRVIKVIKLLKFVFLICIEKIKTRR
jgi:N-acetylglucosaminyldiphosphoundecaprenol N-acetyl-beta-D-mannosaminyltransferase